MATKLDLVQGSNTMQELYSHIKSAEGQVPITDIKPDNPAAPYWSLNNPNPELATSYLLHNDPDGKNAAALKDLISNNQSAKWINTVMTAVTAATGVGLGGYGLYQALKPNNKEKPIKATGLLNTYGATDTSNIEKKAIVWTSPGWSTEIANLYSQIKDKVNTLAGGIGSNSSVLDNPWTLPTAIGAGVAAPYAAIQLGRGLKPDKDKEQEEKVNNELKQFHQALSKQYQTKSAALQACEGLLNSFEEYFEKQAISGSSINHLWNLYAGLAIPMTAGAGLLSYKLMDRLNPDRVAQEAAKDAYRRKLITQPPKVRVTTLDPNEDPEDVQGLSTSDTLMVPLNYTKQAELFLNTDTGKEFKEWFTNLPEFEKVASFLNMVKQATIQLDGNQFDKLLQRDDVAKLVYDTADRQLKNTPPNTKPDATLNSIVQTGGDPEKIRQVFKVSTPSSSWGTSFYNNLMRVAAPAAGMDPVAKFNQLLAANPNLEGLTQEALAGKPIDPTKAQSALMNLKSPTTITADQSAHSGNQENGASTKGGDLMSWIKENPVKAAGAAASLIAMGSGTGMGIGIGLLGLAVTLFGDQIWHTIAPMLGFPDAASAKDNVTEAAKNESKKLESDSVAKAAQPGQPNTSNQPTAGTVEATGSKAGLTAPQSDNQDDVQNMFGPTAPNGLNSTSNTINSSPLRGGQFRVEAVTPQPPDNVRNMFGSPGPALDVSTSHSDNLDPVRDAFGKALDSNSGGQSPQPAPVNPAPAPPKPTIPPTGMYDGQSEKFTNTSMTPMIPPTPIKGGPLGGKGFEELNNPANFKDIKPPTNPLGENPFNTKPLGSGLSFSTKPLNHPILPTRPLLPLPPGTTVLR